MEIGRYLEALVQRDKEMEDIYRRAAVSFGLSDTALWVLYMLSRSESPITQQELCRAGFYPKQTINTVVNHFVEDGIAVLEARPGTKKAKLILLTEAGRTLAQQTADRLYEAELRAYGSMTGEELKQYLDIKTRLVSFLREETEKMTVEAQR